MNGNAANPGSPTDEAAKEAFIPAMRELVRAYQAFAAYSAEHVRKMGLTPPQFDVISTLGNTTGMPLHKLAEKTLITKGTLTGIVDRLEQKGLLQRVVPAANRRSFIAVLTPEGERVFEEVFPAHMAYLKKRFGQLSERELEQTEMVLARLRELF
ncbi:MarR family winged helix-turn-helix transcriptional regulator [Methylocaldum marinum]|nr:MarR family transcriptional regulator [Methylocaldum marinum]